jgi:hypothetical protein
MRDASCEILVARTQIEHAAALVSDDGGGAIILNATSLFSRSRQ